MTAGSARVTDVRVRGGTKGALSLIEVTTGEGVTGIGATGSPVPAIDAIVRRCGLAELVIGEDPLEPRPLWRRMFRMWQAQRGRGSEGGLAVNAMGAIDMALWDLKGKLLDLPLHRLLGGADANGVGAASTAPPYSQPGAGGEDVPAYASGTAFQDAATLKSPDRLAAESDAIAQRGFRALKFGWGAHFGDEDRDRLAAVRDAIGPEVRLMLDVGCPAYWSDGWSASAALRAARVAERFDCHFLEEPLPPHEVAGHKEVTDRTTIDIATGESLSTVYQFQPFIEQRAVDVVQPDAAQMGVTQALEVAVSAREHGMRCVPHGPWSALTVAAHLHILASVGAGGMVEYPGFDALPESTAAPAHIAQFEIVEHPAELVDGRLRLPSRPGLGLGNFAEEGVRGLEAAGRC